MSVTGNIDLVEKYGPQMQAGFEAGSYTLNKVATDWVFDEANRIKMKNYVLDEPSTGYPNGPREGGDRLGTPHDVVDETQILEMEESIFWTVTMDDTDKARGSLHNAGEYIRQRNNKKDIPKVDKNNLRKWALHAGKTILASAAMSKSTIIEQILDIEAAMDEEDVDQENRWCYCPVAYRKYVRLADEWDACDGIVNNMVIKGWEGNIGSMKMVFVPTKLMPKNIELLGANQDSVIAPTIFKLARILREQRGIPGSVLEYLRLYDAFVKGVKQDGVVAVVKNGSSAKATVAMGDVATANSVKTVPFTGTTANTTIYYTMDGTDPRYSKTAVTTSPSGSITITGWTGTILAVARKETEGSEIYTSDLFVQAINNGAKA